MAFSLLVSCGHRGLVGFLLFPLPAHSWLPSDTSVFVRCSKQFKESVLVGRGEGKEKKPSNWEEIATSVPCCWSLTQLSQRQSKISKRWGREEQSSLSDSHFPGICCLLLSDALRFGALYQNKSIKIIYFLLFHPALWKSIKAIMFLPLALKLVLRLGIANRSTQEMPGYCFSIV